MPLNFKENTDLQKVQNQWKNFPKSKKTEEVETHLTDINGKKLKAIKVFIEQGSLKDTGTVILLDIKEEININTLIEAVEYLKTQKREVESAFLTPAEIKYARQRGKKLSHFTAIPHTSIIQSEKDRRDYGGRETNPYDFISKEKS